MEKSILEDAINIIENEIKSLSNLIGNIDKEYIYVIECLKNCKGKIIFTAVGKSAYIAQKIAATMSSVGTPSFFIYASEAAHGDLGCISKEDVVFILSNSGETDEIINIFGRIKDLKVKTILLTGDKNSTLAKCVDFCIDINVEKEAGYLSLAPTTSTTAMMIVGDSLAIMLSKLKGFKKKDFYKNHPGGALGKSGRNECKEVSPAYFAKQA